MDPSAFIVRGYVNVGKPEISMMPADYSKKFTYEAADKLANFLLTLDQQAAIDDGLGPAPHRDAS
jgi:hypothetical protein